MELTDADRIELFRQHISELAKERDEYRLKGEMLCHAHGNLLLDHIELQKKMVRLRDAMKTLLSDIHSEECDGKEHCTWCKMAQKAVLESRCDR